MNLPYPGGPKVDTLAKCGRPNIELPKITFGRNEF